MIWLYFRTGSPSAMGATATLCPRGTAARTVSSSADSPSCRSRVATRTLSAACRCTPKVSRDGAVVICGLRQDVGGRRSPVPGFRLGRGSDRCGCLGGDALREDEDLAGVRLSPAQLGERRGRALEVDAPLDQPSEHLAGLRHPFRRLTEVVLGVAEAADEGALHGADG